MRRHLSSVAVQRGLVLALIALAAGPVSAQLTVTDIGTINGRSSIGIGINAAGDAVGFSFFTGTIGEIGGPPADPFLAHGVLFADGTLNDLGELEGYATCSPLGCESRAFDVASPGGAPAR